MTVKELLHILLMLNHKYDDCKVYVDGDNYILPLKHSFKPQLEDKTFTLYTNETGVSDENI
jgi:hypothetical protein